MKIRRRVTVPPHKQIRMLSIHKITKLHIHYIPSLCRYLTLPTRNRGRNCNLASPGRFAKANAGQKPQFDITIFHRYSIKYR